MLRSKWLLLLVGMMLGGCASGPYVVNQRDQFSGESIVAMQENKLTGLSEMGDFTLNIQKVSKSGHADRFNRFRHLDSTGRSRNARHGG